MNTRAATTRAPATAPSGRMTLSGVRGSRRKAPDRILVVGTEGVGKSTFAADAPSPIFIAAEDGLRHLDTKAFPEPRSFADVLDAIRVLINEPHEYRTLAIDTLDWLEPMLWRHVCERNGWLEDDGTPDIEKPGYGKGYVAALEAWRRLLADLDELRAKREMEIVLLAHASIALFQNPHGPDYARYEAKLHKKAAAIVREWCDVSLFAAFEDVVSVNKKSPSVHDKGKGTSTGRRVFYTERTAAWDAKNRLGLPFEISLSYADFDEARIAGQPSDPAALLEEIAGLILQAAPNEEEAAKWRAAVEPHKGNAINLAKLVNRLRSRITQKGVQQQ